MDSARRVSRFVDDLLHQYYSEGALIPHIFDTDDGVVNYTSMSDAEAILGPVNAIQSDLKLNEFIRQFRDKEYTFGQRSVHIRGAKIVYPHTIPRHDLPPPHPLMSDAELAQYKWPNGRMNREGGDYVGSLWIDIGQDNLSFDDVGAETVFMRSFRQEEWVNVLAIPIMVGTNRCNVSIIRAYLNSADPQIKERAAQILRMFRIETDIPDGYFVIHGKMKKINTADKLQMNMIYTIKIPTVQEFGTKRLIPVGQRVAEVRSLRAELGLAYHQLLLTMETGERVDEDDEETSDMTPRGSNFNRDIFRLYNSIISIMIDKSFDAPLNIFDLVRGYVLLMFSGEDEAMKATITTDMATSMLVNTVREMCDNNMEIMRAVLVTLGRSRRRSDDDLLQYFVNTFASFSTALADLPRRYVVARQMFRKKFLPHCEDLRDEQLYDPELDPNDDRIIYPSMNTFEAKIRFLSMMIIELMLSVTEKLDVTDRKDFSYKRWESAGYLLRDYMRSLFLSQSRIDMMINGSNHLVAFMNKNQWPSRYRARGSYKQSKNDHRDGIVDDVPKFNPVSMIDGIRTVKISAKSSVNTASIRRIHGTQWAFQCPANTPENANIGLNNNLAEAVLITDELTADEREAISELILSLPDGEILLMVDGNPVKYVSPDAYNILKDARRDGSINRGVGIAAHFMWEDVIKGFPVIVLRTSHGRPIVPLFVLNQDESRLAEIENLLEENLEQEVSFESLIQRGIVEFVDPYEMVYNVVVAEWIYFARNEVDEKGSLSYTHSMIMPSHILSQATNCLRYQENGPAARATYGTVHMKQSIGRPFKYPEERFDHEINYLHNPEPPLISTATSRRIGPIRIGRNLKFAIMSFNGNVDDGVHFSEDLVDSNAMNGVHYNIFESDHSITSLNAYNYQLNDDLEPYMSRETGPLIDPNFSDSVIVPYGDPYTMTVTVLQGYNGERPANTDTHLYLDNVQALRRTLPRTASPEFRNIKMYNLKPGHLYVSLGVYKPQIYVYRNQITGDVSRREVRTGEQPHVIPGYDILAIEGYKTMAENLAGQDLTLRWQYTFGLALVSGDALRNNPYERKFIGRDPVFTLNTPNGVMRWYGSAEVRIPRTSMSGVETNTAKLLTIRPKRAIKRGDVAVKVLERDSTGRIINVRKERFDITHGFVEDIIYGPSPKIKGGMPIGPKPGNKYAALYAQKGVNAKVVPRSQMPKAKWINTVTGKEEEIIFDVVFNPLAFPSRMTIGFQYELFIAGTLDYLFSLQTSTGETYQSLYERNARAFNEEMLNRFNVTDAHRLVSELSDDTPYVYDKPDQYRRCKDLRIAMGIPEDGLYDLYLPDENGAHTQRIETPILCGTAYYVALRHLVDNKRRARGYVGKRNPLTLQPVKGRRVNGGAMSGTMEIDALKAHGAGGLVLERTSRVSDHKMLLKCPDVSSLVSFNQATGTYTCIETGQILNPSDVIEHDTVWSWHLWQEYCRSISININEYFQ